MLAHNVMRLMGEQSSRLSAQTFTVTNDAPTGYPISIRVWRNKPIVATWTVNEFKQDVGARQCVEFDGTHYYTTSQYPLRTDTNTHLLKWDSDWNFITERDCVNDGTTAPLGQVNGIHLHTDGLLYVSAANFPGPEYDSIHIYDPTDLSYLGEHNLGHSFTSEQATYWLGSWWVCYNEPTTGFLDRYDDDWVFIKRYQLQKPWPSKQATSGGVNGITVIGDILYCNWHEGTSKENVSLNAYMLKDDELLDLGWVDFPAEKCGQGVSYRKENNRCYWASRPTGGASPYHAYTTTPVFDTKDLYCDEGCADDFSDLRVVDGSGNVLCGEGTGWMENKVDGFYCWLHFVLQEPIVGSADFTLTFGDADRTWSDNRASVVTVVDDFEDGTRGNFSLDYNTVTAVTSSDDKIEGALSLDITASGGGPYAPSNTYNKGISHRTIGYMRREDTSPLSIYFMEGGHGYRPDIRIYATYATSHDVASAGDVYFYTPEGKQWIGREDSWSRFEIRVDRTNDLQKTIAYQGDGGGREAASFFSWRTLRPLSPAYDDLCLYGTNYSDLVFGLPLVIPEPTVGSIQAPISVQSTMRSLAVDLDADGKPDTILFSGGITVAHNGDSVHIDIDQNGDADVILPKP